MSQDQRLMAVGGIRRVSVLDLETGEALRTWKAHDDWIKHLQISPDNRYLLTASEDKLARMWDIQTGQCVLELTGHETGVGRAFFSSNMSLIYTCGLHDGIIHVWRREDGSLAASLFNYADASPCCPAPYPPRKR